MVWIRFVEKEGAGIVVRSRALPLRNMRQLALAI